MPSSTIFLSGRNADKYRFQKGRVRFTKRDNFYGDNDGNVIKFIVVSFFNRINRSFDLKFCFNNNKFIGFNNSNDSLLQDR